jgi:hypothetical protein
MDELRDSHRAPAGWILRPGDRSLAPLAPELNPHHHPVARRLFHGSRIEPSLFPRAIPQLVLPNTAKPCILYVHYIEGEAVKPTIKKKTYNLDVEILEKARRVLQARTETEAIEKALEKTIRDSEIQDSLERLLRVGRFRTIYR